MKREFDTRVSTRRSTAGIGYRGLTTVPPTMAIILRIGAWLRTNISHQGAIYVHGGVVAQLPAHRPAGGTAPDGRTGIQKK